MSCFFEEGRDVIRSIFVFVKKKKKNERRKKREKKLIREHGCETNVNFRRMEFAAICALRSARTFSPEVITQLQLRGMDDSCVRSLED